MDKQKLKLKDWIHLIRNARQASALLKQDEQNRRYRFPLMSLELADENLTLEEIFLKCLHVPHMHEDQVARVARSLYARTNRHGELTVDEALKLYGTRG